MKTLVISVCISICFFPFALAEEQASEKLPNEYSFSFALSSGFSSEYVIQNGLKLHDEAWHTQGTLFLPKGFYFDAFMSLGLDDSEFSSDLGDEIDWALGWSSKIYDKIGVDARVSYYDLHDVFDFTKEDLVFPYLEVNYGEVRPFTWFGFTAYASVENPFTAQEDNLSQGLLTHGGVRYAFSCAEFLDIAGRLEVTHDDGALGLDTAFLCRYEIGLVWKLNEYITLNVPWIKYSDLWSSVSGNDPREDELFYGGGIILNFGT